MISIIVPVYNVEQYLRTCLDSLLGQTYSDIEVICVNDGSQDRSGYILAEYLKKDARLKVITQENKGISQARNRALEEARGNWIMFVDSDDWVDLTTCEQAMAAMKEYNADVVLWGYTREFANGKSSSRPLMEKDTLFDEGNIRSLHRLMVGPVNEELYDPTLLHSWGTVWGKLYSRNAISGTTFTDTQIVGSAEDALFNMEVFTHVKRACYVKGEMYHYRKEGASFTRRHNKHLNERWMNLYAKMADVIHTYNLPSDFYKALNNRIALGLVGQGFNECVSNRNVWGKVKVIRQIITQKQYRLATRSLSLQYFPPHWYLFFWSAKNNKAAMVYLLLLIINKQR